MICGGIIGITYRNIVAVSLGDALALRRLGSSVTEGARMAPVPFGPCPPICPVTPRNAPVPPVIAQSPPSISEGPPGGMGGCPLTPAAVIDPISIGDVAVGFGSG